MQHRVLPLREGGVFSWRLVAVLSLMGCIAVEVLFNILPIDHGTPLLYWFFPVALLLFSQLYFNLHIAKHFEIKLLLAFLAWSCAAVVLNYARLQLVDSYEWFACACTAMFLCFSLPYAFEKEAAKRVLTLLAVVTLVAVVLLSIVSLIAVFASDIAAKVPSIFDGVGIWEGRLTIDTHPNRSAPAPALGVILAGYLIAASRKRWHRVLAALGGVVCFVPLALTVSRTAILGAGIAVGFEVFLALREVLKNRMRVVLRSLLCLLAAGAVIFAFYKGAELTVQASNVAFAQQAQALPEVAEPVADEVITRGLTGVDSFSGRTDIWLGIWKGLLQNPKILVFGTGPCMAGPVMVPYFPEGLPVGIFHNSLLGTLVSFGVVGLLFVLVFLVLVAVFAFRLSFGKRTRALPLAVRMLPAVLIYAVAEGMMEDFLFAYASLSIAYIWFMIAAGFIIHLCRTEAAAQDQVADA